MRLVRTCSCLFISSWLAACLGERPGAGSLGGQGGDAGADPTKDGAGAGGSGAAGSSGAGDAGVMGGLVAARLEFGPLPEPVYASRPLGPIAVQIVDADGILVSSAEPTVTLAIGANPGGANLIGYATVAARGGTASFETLGLNQPGAGYTLTASAEGLAEATSAPFDVARLPFERVVTGLYGGIVSHVALGNDAANVVFASGPAGVFRSSNRGSSWAAANFGSAGAVGLVAVDPSRPERVYATPAFGDVNLGASGALVLFSDNGGDVWRPLRGLVEGDLGGIDVGAFAIDPESSSIVYAGNRAGIFRSTDAGQSWVKTSFPFESSAITIDPIAPATLYASAFDRGAPESRGIYKSIDRGNNWVPIDSPSLPADIIPAGPQALLATPAAVFVNEYRSTDGGATWTAGAAPARAYAYSPSNVQRVYAAEGAFVRVSEDGGQSFGPESSPNALINSLVVDRADADRVYAATDSGVFLSSNAGANWSDSSIGITTQLLYSAAIDPTTVENVFVGGRGGVYVTNNGGATWRFSELGSGIDEVTALRVDPVDASIVYACTSGALFHRSDDGGDNWSAGIDTGGFAFCYDIAVSGSFIWVPTSGGVRRSLDGGASWEDASRLDFPSFSVSVAADGSALYAGCSEGTYKSLNQGEDWTLMTRDLASAFLVDPLAPTTVYMGVGCSDIDVATGSGGVRRSTDGGESWEPTVAGACITALLGRGDGSLIAVGSGAPAFSTSVDRGLSWQPAGIGIQGEPTDITASSDGQTLYVPTTLGLYKSESGGL